MEYKNTISSLLNKKRNQKKGKKSVGIGCVQQTIEEKDKEFTIIHASIHAPVFVSQRSRICESTQPYS
jgi:hypothetical protein